MTVFSLQSRSLFSRRLETFALFMEAVAAFPRRGYAPPFPLSVEKAPPFFPPDRVSLGPNQNQCSWRPFLLLDTPLFQEVAVEGISPQTTFSPYIIPIPSLFFPTDRLVQRLALESLEIPETPFCFYPPFTFVAKDPPEKALPEKREFVELSRQLASSSLSEGSLSSLSFPAGSFLTRLRFSSFPRCAPAPLFFSPPEVVHVFLL